MLCIWFYLKRCRKKQTIEVLSPSETMQLIWFLTAEKKKCLCNIIVYMIFIPLYFSLYLVFFSMNNYIKKIFFMRILNQIHNII